MSHSKKLEFSEIDANRIRDHKQHVDIAKLSTKRLLPIMDFLYVILFPNLQYIPRVLRDILYQYSQSLVPTGPSAMLGTPTTHLWLLPLLLFAKTILNLLLWDAQIPFPHTNLLPLLQGHIFLSLPLSVFQSPLLLPALKLSVYYFIGPLCISSRIFFWLLTANSPYFPSIALATLSGNPRLASFCLFLNVRLPLYTNQDTLLLTFSFLLRYCHSLPWFCCHHNDDFQCSPVYVEI